ncbi:hypothetical protein ACSBR1_033538 [Camellia fascicularis]
MQRPTTSSSRASDEYRYDRVIEITQQQQQPQDKHSPKRKTTEGHTGRSFFERLRVRRREMWRSRPRANLMIHVIPVIVLLCFFILCCFSYPVNLEIKDGRIMEIHRIVLTWPLNNETLVDHTVLASATPSNASAPQFLILKNETEAQPVSPTD